MLVQIFVTTELSVFIKVNITLLFVFSRVLCISRPPQD